MGSPAIVMLGQRIGSLVVVAAAPRHGTSHGLAWRCRCDCGREVEHSGVYLREIISTARAEQHRCPSCRRATWGGLTAAEAGRRRQRIVAERRSAMWRRLTERARSRGAAERCLST